MQNKTIVNVAIGASTLKVIHCEKQDTDFIIKNSVILETGSNLYLNENNLNVGFIEDKLRIFFYENKIRNGLICFSLPDYVVTTRIASKQQVLTNEYVSSIIKGRLLTEVLDDGVQEEHNKTFDCQILNVTKLNPRDENDGTTELVVTIAEDKMIKDLKRMCKRLKMIPAILEPETNGLLRLINMFDIDGNYFIVDIGEIYTKIVAVYGKQSIDYHIIPSGVYKIDGLISSMYQCPPVAAREKRQYEGIISSSEVANRVMHNFISQIFSAPLVDYLDNIQNMYGGLQFINKFLISGGAWNIPEFKNIVEEQTLKKFDESVTFESYSQFCNRISFDNEIVKEDILSNINAYASCVGLSLRGGI